jgi:4-hydroxy-tetrahydrodipicolinate synthase
MLTGIIAAMVTPLNDQEECSEETSTYTQWLMDQGMDGLLALGTGGEGILLGPKTWLDVLAAVMDTAGSQIPVAVQCAGLSRDELLWRVSSAVHLKASGIVLLPPFYYHYTDDELSHYFHDVLLRWPGVSFFLHQTPREVPVDISPAVYARLRAQNENLRGIIDSSNSVRSLQAFQDADPQGIVLWGGDSQIAEAYRAGAPGVISNIAASLPDIVAGAWKALQDDDVIPAARVEQLEDVFQRLAPARGERLVLQAQGLLVGSSPKPIEMPNKDVSEEFFRELSSIMADW